MAGTRPDFIQEGPVLANAYETDSLLKTYLRWRCPKEMLVEIEPDLKRFGSRCVGEIFRFGELAEAQPPRLVSYDCWGRRIDQIEVSEAWQRLDMISAEEGLIAIGYDRVHGEYSRLHQFAKLYLFHPSSAFYTCPLAMTDGAARAIELHGSPEMKAHAFKHLTSRDPAHFWTSGQWMTEKTGGSDVSGTSTVARLDIDGTYRLFGDKWFTSATTSQMTMALAKVQGATDSREGLSLFYIELRDDLGKLRNIRINRLKDKLGTKALPTAELTLEGTPGVLIGGVGEGVKRVSSILNITRLYNSVTALGSMARSLTLVKDYAKRRVAFGRKLSEQPLHLETIADLQTEFEGVFALGFHMIHLLGRDELSRGSSDESAVLRLMTPILKLWSAKQSIATASEAIECFGGAGYIEDTGLPRLLRDAQVFSIWEGTTNVLSLDVLRVLAKENTLAAYFADIVQRLTRVQSKVLAPELLLVQEALTRLKSFADEHGRASPEFQQASARAFAFGLGRVYAAALLLEFADWCQANGQRPQSVEIARRFCRKPLAALPQADSFAGTGSRSVAGSPSFDREMLDDIVFG